MQRERVVSFEAAKAWYVHRFTCEHVPTWARALRDDGSYHAPQFATDREWYDAALFPGEAWLSVKETHCHNGKPTWPYGTALARPFEIGKAPVPLSDDLPLGEESKAQLVNEALNALRVARDRLKQAGATQALKRVRSALKSTEGAHRHAQLEPYREQRQRESANASARR